MDIEDVQPSFPLPVYSMSEFGEDVLFGFSIAQGAAGITNLDDSNQPLIPLAAILDQAGTIRNFAAGDSVIYDSILDMPAWIFGWEFGLSLNNTGAGANTMTFELIKIVNGITSRIGQVVSKALPAGQGQYFLRVGTTELLSQHSKFGIRISADAGNAAAIALNKIAGAPLNYFKIHLHPHLNHASIVYEGKIS